MFIYLPAGRQALHCYLHLSGEFLPDRTWVSILVAQISQVRIFVKRQLLIYYLVVPPNRLEVLRFRECSRADTSPRTEPLHQRAERHV